MQCVPPLAMHRRQLNGFNQTFKKGEHIVNSFFKKKNKK